MRLANVWTTGPILSRLSFVAEAGVGARQQSRMFSAASLASPSRVVSQKSPSETSLSAS